MLNLNKIELTKKGQTINLEKNNNHSVGEILVNLNWNQKKSGFFNKFNNVDLDLGCLFELKNGQKGCVQALGNAFGSIQNAPFVKLDADDRSGAVAGGENLRINGDKLKELKRILVYSFIYEGAANWSQADGVATLKYSSGSDIEVKLDEHIKTVKQCVLWL